MMLRAIDQGRRMGDRLRWQAFWSAVLVGIALFGVACTSEGGGATDRSATPGSPIGSSAGSPGASDLLADEPDCEELGYPCSLAETPPELIERTTDLLTAASEPFATNGATGALDFLRAQPDIIDAFGDDQAITFRIQGAPPAWLVDHRGVGDGARGSSAAAPTSGGRAGASVAPAMQPISVVGEDTSGDGVVDNRDAKRALVLSPFRWQFGSTDESDLIAERLEAMEPYAGNVTLHANATEDDQAVTAVDWQELDRYDAVFILTHGNRQCDTAPDGTNQCRTMLNTGIRLTQFDILSSGTLSGFSMIGLVDEVNEVSNLDFRLGVDAYFFTRNFPGGLDDTLLYLSACETGSISGDHLAAAAGGDGFVMMAWTEAVSVNAAYNAAGVFVEQLSLGVSSELAYQEVIDRGMASSDSGPGLVTALEHISPRGNEVRLLELPTLLFEGSPMGDQTDISDLVTGAPADDMPDVLELDLRLIGIDDPARYRVIYEVDGELALGSYDLANASAGTLPYEFMVTHRVDLGFDLPAGDISLSAIVQLPEGGESRYTADVKVGGVVGASIRVGGESWEFELASSFGGCIVSGNNVVVGGAVDGDYGQASFSADLRVAGGELTVDDPVGNHNWMAAADRTGMTVLHLVVDGNSQIDDITFEGKRISGTATFIETNAFREAWSTNGAYPGPVQGSFEIFCPQSVDEVGP